MVARVRTHTYIRGGRATSAQTLHRAYAHIHTQARTRRGDSSLHISIQRTRIAARICRYNANKPPRTERAPRPTCSPLVIFARSHVCAARALSLSLARSLARYVTRAYFRSAAFAASFRSSFLFSSRALSLPQDKTLRVLPPCFAAFLCECVGSVLFSSASRLIFMLLAFALRSGIFSPSVGCCAASFLYLTLNPDV